MTATTSPRRGFDPGFPALTTLLVLVWSSGFLGVRWMADATPILTILFWRCLMSGLILLPFALAIRPRLTRRLVAEQVLFGALGMFLYLGGFASAIGLGVPTGLVALIADMLPLGVAVLSGPILGQPLTARAWTGTAIALAGVALVSGDGLRMGDAPLWALALPVGGTLCFALAAVLQRRLRPDSLPVVQSVCLQSLTAAALFGLVALPVGGVMPQPTLAFALGIGWLVLVATFAGYGLYYLCLARYAPARVTSVLYLSPPVTMLWAAMLWDEPLTALMAFGTALTLAGVMLAAGRSAD
ncbi:MAG: EamA family transporter [Rhodobacteraceae bacterium PARR1]|nr:MAG: EamA family transporter [Rhodobacteraceae bacterium PARR1]